MQPEWYYAHDGAKHGPIAEEELKAKVVQGQLLATDLVWKKGMPEWVVAGAQADLWPEKVPPPRAVAAPPGSAPLPAIRAQVSWKRIRGLEWLHVRRLFTWDLQGISILPEERQRLEAAGIRTETIERYAVWRRSVLTVVVAVGILAGIFSAINAVNSASDTPTLGVLVNFLFSAAVWALPISAVLATRRYERIRPSQRIMLVGACFAFLLPLLLSLTPVEWWVQEARDNQWVRRVARVIVGISFYMLLMPTVLALLPGICRACVRVKTLLPAAVAPGWALVGSAPLYALFGAVVLILLYHVLGNFLLLAGALLVFCAPLVYLSRAGLLVRPLIHLEDRRKMSRLQGITVLVLWSGIALLVAFFFTSVVPVDVDDDGQIIEKHVLGFSSASAIIHPWTVELHSFWTEYLTRSLFLTVVFADLLVRMNFSIWRQEQRYFRTPAAAEYDRTMTSFGEALHPGMATDDHAAHASAVSDPPHPPA